MKMLLQLLTSFVILLYFLRTYLWFLWNRFMGKIPNGPFPLPVLGNALAINRDHPYASYLELAQKHGKLYSLMLGKGPMLIVTDIELAKKIFKDPSSAGRPPMIHDLLGVGTNRGLAFWEGETWRELRRFSMAALKDSGMVGHSVETYIQDEATKILKTLETGEPADTMMLLNNATANTIAHLLFGRTFDTDTKEFQSMIRDIIQNFREQSMSGPLEVLPWLRFFPPYRGLIKNMIPRYQKLHKTIRQIIDEHKATFDFENPRDYIDCYLREQRSGNAAFAAGIETTASTAQWALLYLIMHPDVQVKLQRELDRVLGDEERVFWADLHRLPYLEAVILETQRIAAIAPFYLPHKAVEDMQINGYQIPAGMIILGINYATLHDPEVWEEPSQYKPERFLDQDGKIISAMKEMMMPFSSGKRSCPGESLARKELTVFLGTIYKKYWIRAEDKNALSLESVNRFVKKPFKIVAEERSLQL